MKAGTGLTTSAQYFRGTNVIATEGCPVQIEIKGGTTNVNEDPTLASSGTENNLDFNWIQQADNGVHVVLTDVDHYSGTLSSSDNGMSDNNHGLGNDLGLHCGGFNNDASPVHQEVCSGPTCRVIGTDCGYRWSAHPERIMTSFDNYAFYITQSSGGTCLLFVSLF
jgi:hypothetical protein